MENKSAGINALLMCLREDLGRENFDIKDHWEEDQYAIGVTAKNNPGVLAYISIDMNSPSYYVVLELPSSTKEYEPAGEFNKLKYGQLLSVVKKHIGLQNV